MKWWDQMPWSSFSECWALSQLFHSPLSLSSRGKLHLGDLIQHWCIQAKFWPQDSQRPTLYSVPAEGVCRGGRDELHHKTCSQTALGIMWEVILLEMRNEGFLLTKARRPATTQGVLGPDSAMSAPPAAFQLLFLLKEGPTAAWRQGMNRRSEVPSLVKWNVPHVALMMCNSANWRSTVIVFTSLSHLC